MTLLRDLQTRFVFDLFDNNDSLYATYIKEDAISTKECLAIYQNNVFSNYRTALKAVYPVVERLVGEQFFRHTADCYIHNYPSRSGDLNSYGADFSEFLDTFEPAKQLSYLPDVAHLEWMMELAFHSADHDPFDLIKLSMVPADQYGELRFTLHPSIQLLQSNYPVAQIWQVNQPDWQGDISINLQEGACQLLVKRQNFDIAIKPLTTGEYVMLRELAAGNDINSTFCKALETQNDLDLGSFLQQMIQEGVLVDLLD